MKPLDRLSEYLGAIERRLRLLAWTRGAAVTAAAALILTVVAVVAANQFAFSNPSVISARVFLFLGLAFALAAALIVPVIRLNRRHAARKAETRYPQFEERLLTFTEKLDQSPNDPFLPLLAADTLQVAQHTETREVARTSLIFSFCSAAVVALIVLIWLGVSGPGFLGYGTSLLWAGLPKGTTQPYYAIQVDPGNKTIRKRADLLVSATLVGFQASKVRFFAKYASASKWEEAEMRSGTGSAAYQFLLAGVPETLDYYVEAGGVRSQTYNVKVIDLPAVKNIRVTYHFPAWSGMKDEVEDPGGDLRAVEGTTAEVEVQTDRPLASGVLVLDDGTKIPLKSAANGRVTASVPILKDGQYHVAAIESSEDIRLGNYDYFIEARKDQAPELRITRPGRDFRATPIEEVTVQVEAKDDFGLKDVTLHYAVNGGAEKVVPMLQGKDSRNSSGHTVISLEDFKLVPGDIVSLYATAKDARKTVNTDMFFIEAQPFEKNYTQSQQGGGGGGGGGGDEEENQISQRQKEIITATWNQLKGQGAKGTDSENAAFLASVQAKLRDQAKSLADRMKARQLEGAGDSFKSFVQDMEQAVAAMGPASDKLKIAKWQDALQPEQKALQYLKRAEETFRDIQVAFGQRGGGGGGGGGGATRDLQGLFDLELDTEKNQYEGAKQAQMGGANSQQKAIDEALQKLKELAKRQQELAEQQRRNPQQTAQQRYEQEKLLRESEKLKEQLQQLQNAGQLSRNGQQSQQQQGQQGQQQGSQGQQGGQQGQQGQQQGKQGQSGQQGQQGQQGNQQGQQGNQQGQQQLANGMSVNPQQLQQMIDRLKQAADDMREANKASQAGTPQSEGAARRAAERLRETEQLMSGLRGQQSSSQIDNLGKQAEELARRQQDFEGQMRRAFGGEREAPRDQQQELLRQRDDEVSELKKLEAGMQAAVRDLQSTNRQASTKVREALGEMQQMELGRDMQRNGDWIRRGMGRFAVMSESQITAGLNEVRDQLKQAQQAMGKGADPKNDQAVERALQQVEQYRRQLEQLSAQQQGQRGQNGRNGQQPGQNGQQNGQQGGQQQQGGMQQGNQTGSQQQNGQQSGQQSGGQQSGGQQSGGQQSGGQQSGQQGSQPGQGGQQIGQQGGQGSPQYGGGNNSGGFRNGQNAWNGGAWNGGLGGNWQEGPLRPGDLQRSYQETLQSLQQLQQQFRDDPNSAREIQGLIRGMRDFDPFAFGNDPLLSQRIQAALVGVEQVEMELRKKVDDSSTGGSVRSQTGDKVPEGFAKQVEEYFRKLSKGK